MNHNLSTVAAYAVLVVFTVGAIVLLGRASIYITNLSARHMNDSPRDYDSRGDLGIIIGNASRHMVDVQKEQEQTKKKALVVPENDLIACFKDGIAEGICNSASTGTPGQMLKVGNFYEHGTAGEINYNKAEKWYSFAGKIGAREAFYYLGHLYRDGLGGERDLDKAKSNYLKAAESGMPEAMYDLALILKNEDNKKSEKESDYWFKKAAESGIREAEDQLADLARKKADKTENTVDKNKAAGEAVKHWERASESSSKDGNSLYNLGLAYYLGDGVAQDYTKAADYWKQGAAVNNIDSANGLGVLYYQGKGVSKNYSLAEKYLQAAALNDYEKAWYFLGLAYYEDHKYRNALNAWLKAVDSGDGEAMYYIGVLYSTDESGMHNEAQAVNWWKKAAAKGIVPAMSMVAKSYATGHGVPKDLVECRKWAEMATAKGDESAEQILQQLNRIDAQVKNRPEKPGR